MKRNTVIFFGAFSALLIIIGMVVSSNKPESADMQDTTTMQTMQSSNMSQPAAPNTVLISDFAFGPEKLSIKKGTTITWTNQDDAHHDITPTSGASDFTASKLLAKGESHTFTFNQVGNYTYKCSPHPYMKASVEVTE